MIGIAVALAVKTSMLVAVVFALTPLLHRQSAALRHAVLSATVAGAVALPLLALVVPTWSPESIAGSAPGSAALSTVHAVHGGLGALVAADATPAAVSSAGVQSAVASSRTGLAIGALWLTGAAIALAWLLACLGRLRSLARRATPVLDPAWTETLAEVSRSSGVGRHVRLVQTDHPTLLAVWGWWRPTVMLPCGSRHWSHERIRVVLSHELAHVRRGDWLAQIGAELLRATYWFNPLVWLLRSRLRLESERACDDAVLAHGWNPLDYATHLTELARTLSDGRRKNHGVPASAMARRAGLERRIHAMLHPRQNRRPISRATHRALTAALLALTCAIAGIGVSAQALSSFAGTVLDPTDRAVADVRVVLIDPDKGSKYEVRSDAGGRFQFAGVPDGEYTLEAHYPGFAVLRGRIVVAGDATRETHVKLQVGSVQETIVVASSGRPEPSVVHPAEDLQAEAQRLAGPRQAEQCADAGRGGNIHPPLKLKDVRPVYPEALSAAQLDGRVRLQGVIATDGTIRDLRVVSASHPEFERAAVEAVRQWVFDATLLNCQPVEVDMAVQVSFEIRQ